MTTKAQNPNTNCLEGMQCPKCESFGPFNIRISQIAEVNDDGVEDAHGDNEWDDESYCQCIECGESGTVKEFSEDMEDEQLSLVDGLVLFCDVCHKEVEEFCNGHIGSNGVKRCVNCFLAEEGPQA